MREKILKVKDFVEQGRGNSLTEAFKDFIFWSVKPIGL